MDQEAHNFTHIVYIALILMAKGGLVFITNVSVFQEAR
jgi:hypothetical protein